ncbi:MAG: hypothetical protein LBP85_01335 [Prevotellaceae bacterium]|jgi:hypothetical protein|nr:hypothetical protein [Prevotellaceae bacterium]
MEKNNNNLNSEQTVLLDKSVEKLRNSSGWMAIVSLILLCAGIMFIITAALDGLKLVSSLGNGNLTGNLLRLTGLVIMLIFAANLIKGHKSLKNVLYHVKRFDKFNNMDDITKALDSKKDFFYEMLMALILILAVGVFIVLFILI